MAATLHQTLKPIGRSAAAIEDAFLKAGESLSRGLQTFEQLNATMASLSTEVEGGPMDSAASSLDGLSADLCAISAQLPRDVKTLEGLVANNEGIASRLDRLLDHIRMMTIISRSAKIEAIVFDNEALGLASFTQEISRLTNDVQNDVGACARAHAKMFDLLKGVLKSQTGLDRDYRATLADLATELNEAFSVIRERREKSYGFLQDLTARSTRIAQAAGLAFVSLQSGDSIRQRLEHVQAAVERVIALHDGDLGANPTVPAHAREDTVLVLCRLQHAQITDAVASFDEEAKSIEGALNLLIDDTRQLIESSQGIFGGAGDGLESYLKSFRARLHSATALVGTCEASRGAVASVIANLQVMLGDFHQTISNLNQLTLSIVLVGVNAGLKAVRLGPAGRSLVVIADELKRLANGIAKDAEALLPLFDQVRQSSQQLGGEDGTGNAAHATSIDQAIVSIVGDLDLGGRRLDECLTVIRAEGGKFDAGLKQASLEFSRAVAMNEGLLDAAAFLQAMADETTTLESGAGLGRDYASAIIESKYTMEREREIHADITALPIAC